MEANTERRLAEPVLFELIELILRDFKLFQDFMKKPTTDFSVAMDGNRGCTPIRMLPTRMTSFLACFSKAKLLSGVHQLSCLSRHGKPSAERHVAWGGLLPHIPA